MVPQAESVCAAAVIDLAFRSVAAVPPSRAPSIGRVAMQVLRFALGVLLVAFAAIAAGPGARAEEGRRVALVIGQSAYQTLPRLRNPANDASDVAAALNDLGFEVIQGIDLDKSSFQAAVLRFARDLEGAETSLLFYAGHGVQIDDTNHLIPIDANITRGGDLAGETITVDRIVGLMNQFTPRALVFLDACRDNPLTNDIAAGGQSDGFGRGLARVRAEGGTYIAFATAPGNVAYDGQGRNSPFSAALLKHVATPNIDIRLMMSDVRQDVFEATAQAQMPWENNSLIGRFYFLRDDQLERLDSAARTETEAWKAIENSVAPEDFAAFLRDFPDGAFAGVAELKIKALREIDERQNAEGADFVLARATATEEAWQGFLERYPQGLFAPIARDELQDVRAELTRQLLPLGEVHWRSIRNSKAAEDFTTFLRLYPTSSFADLARERETAALRADEINAALLGENAAATGPAADAVLEREVKRKVAQVPVQFVQYGLTALGHQVADVTGVMDPPTKAAIRNYQATIGEAQTGRLTPQQIVDLLMAAAALGDSNAMTAAGIMTASGNGLHQDEETARLWLDRASDKGNGYAMANLGLLYRDGRGGPKDDEKARSLLTVAVSLGVDGAEPILRSLDGGAP
jgi:hypothetical protein